MKCFSRIGIALRYQNRNVHIEAKIASLGLQLPAPAIPKGNFVNYVQVGNLVYLSGHLPQPANGNLIIGTVGKELSLEDGTLFVAFRSILHLTLSAY